MFQEFNPATDELRPRIAVIGVGGGGGNAVANMVAGEVLGVEFILANTDAQALATSCPAERIQLGRRITQGLGAGSVAAVGKAAAEESIEEINRTIDGCHMCFIAAGMGGGTGTGAAPVIAKAARDKGILTVGVVTRPFAFEGSRRSRAADAGIEELQQHVDTLIVIPNQNLFRVADRSTTFQQAFQMADEVLQQGVRGITDLMVTPGLVNLDFADIRSVMLGMGQAMMGSGEASGDDRAREAAEMAISNPLLDGAIKGAQGLIISITGGDDLRLMEIDEAANHIKDLIDPEADIIWGSAINPALQGRIRVSIIATGLDSSAGPQWAAAPACLPLSPSPFMLAPQPVPGSAIDVPAREEACPAAIGDLFSPGDSGLIADPVEPAERSEELQLESHNMLRIVVSEEGTGGPEDVAEPLPGQMRIARGPSLFERVAAMARGAALADSGPDVGAGPDMSWNEDSGAYNRRAVGSYASAGR